MKSPTTPVQRVTTLAGTVIVGLVLFGMAGWGVLALYYFDHKSLALRTGLAAAFALASLIGLVGFALPRWRWRAFAVYLALFAVVLFSWRAIEPSNDRDWQPDVAVLPYASIDGDRVTVHNIRNFDYRTETDFTPGYYDKTFDLRKLDGVDLIATYWMGPAIAHIFLSFDFQGDHLAISIETRKERGEGYSTVQGFFRQYELYYVVADERDVIRLRTNYRKNPPEDVYIYRLRGSIDNGRRLFLQYMDEVNALKDRPEWYNTLTTNCTTAIWMHTRINPGHPPLSWKVLVSGYLPEYLYEIGKLDTSLPFAELQRRAHINARAQAADKAADFSRQIRAGLPGTKLSAAPNEALTHH
ncbi:MAG TPA: DUF4105 domain-containing protein [Candidatus Methylomirabilis sp.]|nr:DUF4105 domain-containing protein [Candidatus Methylomirabilis sp.]